MFEELIQKIDVAVRNLRSIGKLTDKNISESLREIRRVLLEADVNYKVVKAFIDRVRSQSVGERVTKSVTPGQQIVKIVHDELVTLLGGRQVPLQLQGHPTVIMVMGLQGSGKTSFVGKLGVYLRKRNRNPLLVAADTVRPAAVDQLITLGKSADLPVFTADQSPVGIAQKSLKAAKKGSHDTIILDTAGRLHIDNEMMAELVRIRKTIQPHELLYIADSMTGQDAVRSAETFMKSLDFTGIVLTKLDGDARGGAALSIRFITQRPVKFITKGERLDDIDVFYPDRMASRILGMWDVVTLVEKAQDSIDKQQSEKLAKKIKKQSFTLEDFFDQLQQIKRMGPLSQIASMIPGVNRKMANIPVDDNALVSVEAIINSMTVEERQKPHIINGSRRRRIAKGSGTRVQDVNQVLKQFQMMQKMMKQFKQMGELNLPAGEGIAL